ncbi:hypothetical protein K7W42_17290 [Deinococcus sp. HMF7604]|uniref:hypothetical protein n=1 Tax=Deinococcus betulae TaxID=2873312 RepID=UPI001CCEB3FF|nr:hypothetical protein [Deinococcus betulae]MBZ9752605.1 hypothetical protein [Deinococcus betulae]
MNPARAQWHGLSPSLQLLLADLHRGFGQQALTSRWTAAHHTQALGLLRQLEEAWRQERVDLDTLHDLEGLTAHLDLTGTVTCRAALESIQGLFRRVVEATYEVLAAND